MPPPERAETFKNERLLYVFFMADNFKQLNEIKLQRRGVDSYKYDKKTLRRPRLCGEVY